MCSGCSTQFDSETGLVCSPPIGSRPGNLWAEVECAFLNGYQARWQILADTIGFGFAQGKTMMWRRADLEKAGGIRRLGEEVAEDAASTKVVREAGHKVRIVDAPFPQPLGTRALADVWKRQARWAQLRRASFLTFFLPEILSGALLPLAATAFLAFAFDLPVAATLVRIRRALVRRGNAARLHRRLAALAALPVRRDPARSDDPAALGLGLERCRLCLARQCHDARKRQRRSGAVAATGRPATD